MNLLDFPDCMLEQIFEYLPYDEIARKRIINSRINKVCQRLLNCGFYKMVKRHSSNLKRIKSLLPRRESERRNHPMAKHADILTCIETRISMLSMTYTKYMELDLCCFIPGKIIDEVIRILNLIETTTRPPRAFDVLQELRDLSSMAIEHFDEKISNSLKKSFIELSTQKFVNNISSTPNNNLNNNLSSNGINSSSNNNNNSSFANLRMHLCNDQVQGTSEVFPIIPSPSPHMPRRSCGTTFHCNEAILNRLLIKKMAVKYKDAIKKFNRMIHIQNKQARLLRENAVTMSEMNAQIVELKRRIEIVKANRNGNVDLNTNTNAESIENPNEGIAKTKISKPRAATLILKRRITENISNSLTNDIDEIPSPDALAKKSKIL